MLGRFSSAFRVTGTYMELPGPSKMRSLHVFVFEAVSRGLVVHRSFHFALPVALAPARMAYLPTSVNLNLAP